MGLGIFCSREPRKEPTSFCHKKPIILTKITSKKERDREKKKNLNKEPKRKIPDPKVQRRGRFAGEIKPKKYPNKLLVK